MNQFNDLISLINRIGKMKGKHNSFISLYIPATKSRDIIISHIKNEISECRNIKNKLNRNAVSSSLHKILL